MRLQSKKSVTIRDKVLGGAVPLTCLPLVAVDQPSLLEQAEQVLPFHPDTLEWRVDKFDAVKDTQAVTQALDALRRTIGNIPLIFTCRIIDEGGFQEISPNDRLRVNEAVIASGRVDLVDTEILNGEAMIGEVRQACLKTKTRLILSYHNFDHTPEEPFLTDRLCAAQQLGGDVAKLAVMPKNYRDVLTLLSATYTARTELLDIPMITMAMGTEGAITRIAGGLFGSDLTFAIGKVGSAPGQIPIGDLRKAWSALAFSRKDT